MISGIKWPKWPPSDHYAMYAQIEQSFFEVAFILTFNTELIYDVIFEPSKIGKSLMIKYYSPTVTHDKNFVYDFCIL